MILRDCPALAFVAATLPEKACARGTVSQLSGKGARFERFEGMSQDDAGIWLAPGGATKVCWFKDPDSNLLSLTQSG